MQMLPRLLGTEQGVNFPNPFSFEAEWLELNET